MMDCSILATHKKQIFLYTYDMFDNTYTSVKFNASIKIFPNKFLSLKKKRFVNHEIRDKAIKSRNPVQNPYFGRFSKPTFFEREFCFNASILQGKKRINLNSITAKTVNSLILSKSHCRTTVHLSIDIGIIVPVIKRNKRLTIPLSIVFQIGGFFASISICVAVARMFKLPSATWNFFNIYQMMLGLPTLNLCVRSLREKIICITIVVLSITVISELIMNIQEIQFDRICLTEISTFNNFKRWAHYLGRGMVKFPQTEIAEDGRRTLKLYQHLTAGYPLIYELDDTYSRLFETGQAVDFDDLLSSLRFTDTDRNVRVWDMISSSGPSHLALIFIVIVGFALSIITFILEICCGCGTERGHFGWRSLKRRRTFLATRGQFAVRSMIKR